MGMVLGFVLFGLNIVGLVMFRKKMDEKYLFDHPFLIYGGYIALFAILFGLPKSRIVVPVMLSIVALITIIAIIIRIVNVNQKKKQHELNIALLDAVKNDDKDTVQKLLSEVILLENEQGLLQAAIENNDKEIIELLIEKGADINTSYDTGETMLEFAKNNEMVEFLRSKGAKTNAEIKNLAVEIYSLGIRYSTGSGVEKDENKAFEYYRKAAEMGNVLAQNSLAHCYYEGVGVYRDVNMALRWWEDASDQGLSEAMYNIGVCYYNGFVTGIQDVLMAGKWWKKAADLGYPEAIMSLNELKSKGLA